MDAAAVVLGVIFFLIFLAMIRGLDRI